MTLFSLLKKSANPKSYKQIQSIHQKIISYGLQNDTAVCKHLISDYISCQEYKLAKMVLLNIENPLDITLWNGLISAYTKNFMFSEAIELFEDLLRVPNLRPDSYTYPSVLKACGGLKRVEYGKKIHVNLIKTGFLLDVVVASSLISVYAKSGGFELAVKLFDEMPEKDVASWNNVISCYYQSGQYEKAFGYFERMKSLGFSPNSVSFTTAISSCARLLDVEKGKRIHEEVERSGLLLDGFVRAALVDMYGKCGCLERAKEVFDPIGNKSLVSWNAMIGGYSLRGDSVSCIELLVQMNQEKVRPSSTTITSLLVACAISAHLRHGKFVHGYIIRNNIDADIFTDSSLVELYFKCGSVVLAERIFRTMQKTNIVAWNVMISGYISAGCYIESLGIYDDMREAGMKPDAITFTSALAACSQLAALERGKEIDKSIVENKLESNEIVMGALLDMYAKCGAIDEARDVFNKLSTIDLLSWTSMIVAYGSHGQAFEALRLFEEMLISNIKPDRISFLAVVSACSHAGLVEKGQHYFNLMVNNYGIQPTIAEYSCLIDLLGRTGRLYEAYKILQGTQYIKEDVDLLSTLFSACHLHGELKLGEEIAKVLIEKDPDDPSTYIVLEKMYASSKKWNEARRVRLKMKDLGLRKNPGCSWLEIDRRIQSFLAEDKAFPQAELVYDCLSLLQVHMEKDERAAETAL